MPRKPGTSRAKHTRSAVPQALPGAAAAGPQPVTLTGERLRLWNDTRVRFVLEPASESILRSACEAQERADQLAAQVSAEGATFRDRFGQVRANPAATLERDFRGLAGRLLQQLAARMEGQA